MLVSRLIAAGLVLMAFLLDRVLHLGLRELLLTQGASQTAFGCLIMVLSCVKGRFSAHRTFTHSFLFTALLTYAGWQFTPLFGTAVCAGCLSHLFLDLTNKRPVQLFYPFKKGYCLHLFFADRTANRVLLWTGLLADILLLSWCLGPVWR